MTGDALRLVLMLVGGMVLAIAVRLALAHLMRGRDAQQGSVEAVVSLCTPHELGLFQQLRAGLDPRLHLCAKVRLVDLIRPQAALDRATFNRLKAKHVDFVIIDAMSARPVLAIELDDASHTAPARRQRDAMVEEAFRQAGIPLVRGSKSQILQSEIWRRCARSAAADDLRRLS